MAPFTLFSDRYDLAFKAYEACLQQQGHVSTDVMASLFQIAAWYNLDFDSDFDNLRPSETREFEEIHVAGKRPGGKTLLGKSPFVTYLCHDVVVIQAIKICFF